MFRVLQGSCRESACTFRVFRCAARRTTVPSEKWKLVTNNRPDKARTRMARRLPISFVQRRYEAGGIGLRLAKRKRIQEDLPMKRFIISSLMLGITAMFTGCGEETKKEVKVIEKSPGGTETKTITEKDTKTGDKKP